MCTVTRYHISPGVLRYTKYTQRPDLRVRAVLGRVRDRACACTDALHNIFAIVKCKVPAREGVPLSQLFLASRSHTPLRNPGYVYVYMCAWVCESERREATGAAKARGEVGERRLESKFLSSHVNRDVAGAIEGLSTYFYIPFLKRPSCAPHSFYSFKYLRSKKSHRDITSRERARWMHDKIISEVSIIIIKLVKSDQREISNRRPKASYHCYIIWMENYTPSKNLEYIS